MTTTDARKRLVEAQLHSTRPPTPPRPALELDEDDYPVTPAGWTSVVWDESGTALCGWTDGGHFFPYAPTERIAQTLLDYLIRTL